MARRNRPAEDAIAAAEAQAAKDAELLAAVQERDANPEPQEPTNPTIADRFVAMNALVAKQRAETRLSEATLSKNLELALNYFVWETQREEQRAQQRQFDPAQYGFPTESGSEGTSEGEGQPEPHEYLGTAEASTDETEFPANAGEES